MGARTENDSPILLSKWSFKGDHSGTHRELDPHHDMDPEREHKYMKRIL